MDTNEEFNNNQQNDNVGVIADKLADSLSEQISKLYIEFSENLSNEQIILANKLLKKVAGNVYDIITDYVDIHKEIYANNETYSNFVKNVWNDEEYEKLISIGEESKAMDRFNAVRSLGLSFLINKITRTDKKAMTKKIFTWIDNCEFFMDMFNVSSKYGANFPAFFFATITVQEILFDDITKIINAM